MSEFNFNSQVCTDKNQSERLLALGLKKETADMCWTKMAAIRGTFYVPELAPTNMVSWRHTPAWSLGRLLALGNGEDWNAEITLKDEKYGIHTGFDTTWYDDIFEAVIAWIEEDIKEGYFNKEYLV